MSVRSIAFGVGIFGVLIRLIVAPLTAQPLDVYPFFVTSLDMLAGNGPYGSMVYSYPPIFALVLYPVMWVGALVMDPIYWLLPVERLPDGQLPAGLFYEGVTGPFFNLLLKLPLIVADLSLGLLLYNFVKERATAKAAVGCFAAWFLNPLVIWISSVHGQFDVLASLALFVTFVLLLRRQQLAAGVAFGLAVITKGYPALFGPFLVFTLLMSDWSNEISGSTGQALRRRMQSAAHFVLGFLLPLILFTPPLHYWSHGIDAVFRRTSALAVGGFSPWGFTQADAYFHLFQWAANNAEMVNRVTFGAGILLSSLVGMATAARVRKNPADAAPELVDGAILTSVIIFSTMGMVNPQYLLMAIPFYLVAAKSRSVAHWVVVGILSLSGLVFELWLNGPWLYFYPGALAFGWPPVAHLHAWTDWYLAQPGFMNHSMARDIWVPASVVGYLALLASAVVVVVGWKLSSESGGSRT